MNELAKCIDVDEYNKMFQDIIFSLGDGFFGIPFLSMDSKDFRRKGTGIIKDIEMEPTFVLRLKFNEETFLPIFNDAVQSIARKMQSGITNGTGISPEMNSLRSISIANGLRVPMPHGYDLEYSVLHLIDSFTETAGRPDFIVMSKFTFCKFKPSLSGGLNAGGVYAIDGVRVFVSSWAGDSIYAGKWAEEGEEGLAIIYPKDAMTSVEILLPTPSYPVVRLKIYLNLAMFGENNVFRMDGF